MLNEVSSRGARKTGILQAMFFGRVGSGIWILFPSRNVSSERGFSIQSLGLKPAGGAGRQGGGISVGPWDYLIPLGLPDCSVAHEVRMLLELKVEQRGRQKSWLDTHSGQFGQEKEQKRRHSAGYSERLNINK